MGVIDELIASAQPRTDAVTVCARGDLVTRHRELVAQLNAATRDDESLEGGDGEAAAIAEQIVAVEAEMDEARTTIKVKSIGGAWADLLRDNPPTGDQRLMGYDNNPDTFQPAAVAACATDPQISLAQAIELRRVLDEGEWGRLFNGIAHINRSPMPSPKLAAATEILRASGRSSSTSPLEGSLEDGSSVSGAAQ